MDTSKSQELFASAQKYIPGGVNSPVRAFKSVGLKPLFIEKASGYKTVDVDGNEFIDYLASWGPLILGHSHPQVVEAICQAAAKGSSYGAPCQKEIELAQMICEAIPSIDLVRMVNSGTEATMSAIRLARACTGRDKILKFEGCYHGHADSFLIKAGSGALTSGVPNSPGVPEAFANNTLIARYNNIDSVKEVFEKSGHEIAALIVEPIAGNMGLVPSDREFLQGLRKITEEYGSLLIFDEVISGFRACYGAYQNEIGIEPDLTTLGKIIGGGLPVGAFGGKRKIMEHIAPLGDVYQAGTLAGNPLAMAAGAETLKILKKENPYDKMAKMCIYLTERIKNSFAERSIDCAINRTASMFSVFFTGNKVVDFESVMTADTEKYALFYRELFERGVYFPPSQFEVCFVSSAHDSYAIENTIEIIREALDKIS